MQKSRIRLIFASICFLLSIFFILFTDSGSRYSREFERSLSTDTDFFEEKWVKKNTDLGTSVLKFSEGESLVINSDVQGKTEQDGYRVIKVIDGDTFDVEINDKIERVRMIGIDTPESVDPRKTIQCFGTEASNKSKEVLSGQFVRLETDQSQGDRDRYGRLLRYVYLPDGTNFGLFMISEGYAHEYTYRYPYKYQSEFKQAEIEAQNNKKGLWSPDTCSGNK